MLQVPDKKKKSVNDDVPIFGASSSPSSSTPVVATSDKEGDGDLPIFSGSGTNKKKDGSENYGTGSPSESVSDVESTEQIAPKSFIENDIENSQYSRDNAKQFTFESIGQPSPMVAPIGADVMIAKEKEKKNILSNSNELSKYSKSRIDALTGDIQNLKKQLSAHTLPSSTQMGIPSLTPTQFYTDGADSIKDEIAAKQKYLQQFKDNLLKLASHQVVKERNIPNPSQQDIESIGADVLQVTHDAGIGDDLEVLRTIGEVAAPRKVPSNVSLGVPTPSPTNYTASAIPKSDIDLTTQNIKYKFYKTGAEALQQYYINQAEEFGDKAKDNIAALNEINQKLSKPMPANDRDALVAAQQAIMQDSDVKEYLNSLDNAIVYSKKSKDAVDNFPQVKRQQMQQTLNDVYFNMLLAKDAATSAIPNNLGLRVANWLFGDTAGEEDVKSLSKATGISEDQVRDIINQRAQGWFSGSDKSGVRVPGFLPAIAQGMDETMGNAAMGIDRFFGAKNAEASNRILSDKLQSYNLRAQKAKLYDDAGKLNFNPYSLMNEMGRGIGQTAIYAAPSMVGGGLATGVAEGLGATVKNAENVGKVISGLLTVDSGFAASYEDAYKEAARYTNDESVRRAYAFKVGLANGLSETILEPAAVAKKVGLGKNTTKETFNTFLKNYKEGGAGKAVWEGLKEAGGVIRDENIEEILVNIAQNKAKESDLGVDTSPSEFMDQSIQTIISTTLTTLPLGIGAGMNGARDQSGIRRNALFEAGNNPELYTGELKKKFNNGSLNQDQYNERVSVVNTMAAIVKNIKPTDIHGNKLSYDQKSKLAAQQFRILNNNRILESGATVEAEKPIIEADNKEAIKNQSDILNATPTESPTEESVLEFDESVPQSSKDALIEKIQSIDSRNAMVKQAQQNPEEGIAFIQDQATGMTSDRSSAAQPTYDETVKMFGGDVVNHAVSILPQETKDMILRSWKEKSIEAPAPLINALQATAGEMQQQNKKGEATNVEEEKSPTTTVADVIDKPVTYNGKKATIIKDGQTLVAKINGENVEYELGNIDEIKGDDISDYGIEVEQSAVSTNESGDIVAYGNTYKNGYSNPLAAINYDKDGNVVSVDLETEGGQKRNFKGQVAEDIAYQIQLKEISKDNESRQKFEDFVEQDDEAKQQIISGYDEAIAAKRSETDNEAVRAEPTTESTASKSEVKKPERKVAEKKPKKESEADNKRSPNKIKVGDEVQWTSQGVDQFDQPKKITAVSDDGSYVFVEGSNTGIPTEQVNKTNNRSDKKSTPKSSVNSEGVSTKNASSAVEIPDDKAPKEAAKAYRDSANRLRKQGDVDGAKTLDERADDLEKGITKKSPTKNKITTLEQAETELKNLFALDKMVEDDEGLHILRNTELIKTNETRDEDGEILTKAYKPVYINKWYYADNSNPQNEIFYNIDEALKDLEEPGDYDSVDDDYEPYKQTWLEFQEVWIDDNGNEVEDGRIVDYDSFASENENNEIVDHYGKYSPDIATEFHPAPQESSNELEEEVYFGIHKDINRKVVIDGITYSIETEKSGKYRPIIVSDNEGNEVGRIELRISDHTYNPSRNTSGSNFISVEISNRDKGRYASGLYQLRFDGDNTFEEVSDAVNERIDEIIEGWDLSSLDSLTKNNEESGVSLINKNGKINYGQLKKSADSGTTIFERLSPPEKQGGIEGGRINVEASLITEAIHGSSQDGRSGGKKLSPEEIRNSEEEALTKYAKDTGVWVEDPFSEFGDTPDAFGAEQNVYLNKDGISVTKINSGFYNEDWRDFFERIALHNTLFPEAKYTVKGFTNLSGDFSVIIEQPLIQAERGATKQEIIEDLSKRGFENIPEEDGGTGNDYINKKTGVIVKDLHGKNVLSDDNGNLFYIDPIIELDTQDKGYGGTRQVGGGVSLSQNLDKISSISVSGKQNTVNQYLEKGRAVLSQLYPNATITTYDTADEYYKQEKRPVGSAGVFHPKEQRLALNLELISKHGIENTVFHEVIHPIVNEAIASREGALDSAWERLRELKDVPGMEVVFQHVQAYAGRGANIQKVEGITEFLTQVADGRIDISKMPEKTSSKIIDLINKIFEALGISKRIGTPADLKRLADAIKSSFESADASAIKEVIGRRESAIGENSFDSINGTTSERADIEKRAKEDGTWMKAPNGKSSNLSEDQWIAVRTSAFKKWFGDWKNNPAEASKVVDENGEPLVVYHGSKTSFPEFKFGSKPGSDDKGFYFSGQRSVAEYYRDPYTPTSVTREFFLNIRNPYIHNEKIVGYVPAWKKEENEKRGYDGERGDGWKNIPFLEIVPYYPNQIKSATENSGSFSGKSNNVFDSLNQKEQEDAIKDIIARSENIDEEKLKDLIKKYTGWSDEKVNSFFTPKQTGITHAQTKETAREFGFEEYEKDIPQTIDEWDREAEKKIKEGYDINALISKIESGHLPTNVEQRIMSIYISGLEAEIEKSPSDENIEKLIRAVKASDIGGGREIARSLVSRKGSRPRDNSLASFFIEQSEANDGMPLTEQQKKDTEKEYNEIKAAQKAFEEKILKLQQENAKLQSEQEVSRQKRSYGKSKKSHADYVAERNDILKNIKDKLKAARTGESGLTAVPVPYAKELIAIAPDVMKLTKSLVEEGITKLSDIVKDIHASLKDSITDITENDIHDIIAGKYNEPKPTRSQLSTQLQDLRTEAKLINEIESALRGEPKTERQKRQKNLRIEQLRKRLLEIYRSQGKSYDEKALDATKKRIQKSIDELEAKLKSGDFSISTKKSTIKLDKEAIALKDKLRELQHERAIRLMQEKYENRSTRKKALDRALEIANIPRTIMSSLDYSAPLRQAVIPTVSHPIMAAKAAVEMFKQSFSQKRFDRWFADLREDPRYDLMQKSGLYIADPHDPRLAAKEEAFMNNLVERIPILGGELHLKNPVNIPGTNKKIQSIGGLVKGSERAYVGYLNKMRVDLFNRMVDAFENDGFTYENSPELYNGLSSWINNSTGRGNLGAIESAAPVLNSAFFSPRLIASRFNILGLSDIALAGKGLYGKMPTRMRVEALKDLIKFFAAGSTLLSVLAYAFGGPDKDKDLQIELDPRSSDFGKIKYGNTRWDIWGGFQQYIRILAQLISGQKKSASTEKVSELSGEGSFGETRGDVAQRFFRGKLSPVFSMGADILTGRTISGEKVTVPEEIKSHFAPLLFSDVKEAMKDNGIQSLFSVGIPSVFGVGVQTYNPRGYENVNRKEGVYKTLFDKDLNLSSPEQKEMTDKQYDKFLPIREKIFKDEWDNVIKYGAMLNEDGSPTLDENKSYGIKPFDKLTHDELTSIMKSISSRATRLAEKEIGYEKPKEKKNQEFIK